MIIEFYDYRKKPEEKVANPNSGKSVLKAVFKNTVTAWRQYIYQFYIEKQIIENLLLYPYFVRVINDFSFLKLQNKGNILCVQDSES